MYHYPRFRTSVLPPSIGNANTIPLSCCPPLICISLQSVGYTSLPAVFTPFSPVVAHRSSYNLMYPHNNINNNSNTSIVRSYTTKTSIPSSSMKAEDINPELLNHPYWNDDYDLFADEGLEDSDDARHPFNGKNPFNNISEGLYLKDAHETKYIPYEDRMLLKEEKV